MHSWVSLVVLVFVVGVGCGNSESGAANDAGTSNGPAADAASIEVGETVDAAPGDSSEACNREAISDELKSYSGPMPTFSQPDVDRCAERCKNQPADCFSEQNCPGIELWQACVNRNAFACSASKGKACRVQYEDVECCGTAAGCAELSCVEKKCPTEFKALQDCRGADTACIMSSRTACLAPAR